MTLRAPSFSAALTRPLIPPTSSAEVALAALLPDPELPESLAGGEQPASANTLAPATTATLIDLLMVVLGDLLAFTASLRRKPMRVGRRVVLTPGAFGRPEQPTVIPQRSGSQRFWTGFGARQFSSRLPARSR